MTPEADERRSLTWRLLPWLIPIGLILVGLVFVAAGLSTAGEPAPLDSADLVPSNVESLIVEGAPGWAATQVGDGVATEFLEAVMVRADATGASTYTARAVVVRFDSLVRPAAEPGATLPPLDVSQTSTVATCVLWDLDVTARTLNARSAQEIAREIGQVEFDDGTLRDGCGATTFG